MTTTKKVNWWQQIVPAVYPQVYFTVAQERGADLLKILERAQLPADVLTRRNPEITFLQLKLLIDATIAEVDDNGIGVDVGLRLPPTAYGSVGYAMLCSETTEDALNLCMRFWPIIGRAIDASFQCNETDCVLDFTLMSPLVEPLPHLVCETTLASFHRGFHIIVMDVDKSDTEIWFTMPPPVYADKVFELLGNVRYNMPANQFRFNAKFLKKPLPMHNPTGLKFAIEQCEREQALLSIEGYKLRERVRQEIVYGDAGYPTLEDISSRLNMTTRTLRRRLEGEGTSYKTLLEEAKRRDALQLLDDRDMEIQRVASLLGYQDPANFTRAFRQWTGQTPSQYRITRSST